MNRKKTKRSPEQVIKLYDWLWRRANSGKCPSFIQLQPTHLTGRCIVKLAEQRAKIRYVMYSAAYRKAVLDIIHSN